MASVADQIMIKMGLDASSLQQGLARSKQEIGATGQAIDKMGAKWKATASMLTRTVIAPIAGFMSLGAVIKSYFGGVSQVAQLTGAYSQKMEEWRKKRAMLARYNREDIELYKKGREAVVKFQITMDDLSAKIMRSVSPAIKWLIDKLNDFSNWIDRNQNNIIRFLSVVAGTITALLIPSFIKLGIAMLTNPLTWIIALFGALILVIDDLVTYLRGGESALDDFWKMLGLTKGDTASLNKALDFLRENLGKILASLLGLSVGIKVFSGLANVVSDVTLYIKGFALGLAKLIPLLGGVAKVIGTCTLAALKFAAAMLANPITWIVLGIVAAVVALGAAIWAVWKYWDQISAWISEKCEQISNWFKDIGKAIKKWFEDKIEAVSNTWTEFCQSLENWYNRIIGWFKDIGKTIKDALNIDKLTEKVKNSLSNMMPDWVKTTLGIDTENKADGSQPTIYEGTDAPIVPDVESMQAMKAQSKGNVNNNISRSQVINVGSNNPAVVTATMREADREMNDADRWIAMASQGAGW